MTLGKCRGAYKRLRMRWRSQALAARREALGSAHPQTLTSVNNLACLLKDQGKLGEAEPLFTEAWPAGLPKLKQPSLNPARTQLEPIQNPFRTHSEPIQNPFRTQFEPNWLRFY